MRSKSLLLLGLALGCGLVASIGISQVMERRSAQPVHTGEVEAIFVALVDINPNEALTSQIIKMEEWPKGKVPLGAVTKLEDIEGKRCRSKLYAGEPILEAKLMNNNDAAGASNQIPKGYRVVPVRVDAVSGGSSLILPSDRVDVLVYLSRNPGNGVTDTGTRTILQDIRVFAVDAVFQRQPDSDEPAISAKTISLLVTPAQAEKLTLASELGAIRLVLRGPDEDSLASMGTGATVADILGSGEKSDRQAERKEKVDVAPSPVTPPVGVLSWLNDQKKEPVASPAEEPTPWKMAVFKGSEITEVQFNGDNHTISVTPVSTPAAGVKPAPLGAPSRPLDLLPRHLKKAMEEAKQKIQQDREKSQPIDAKELDGLQGLEAGSLPVPTAEAPEVTEPTTLEFAPPVEAIPTASEPAVELTDPAANN